MSVVFDSTTPTSAITNVIAVTLRGIDCRMVGAVSGEVNSLPNNHGKRQLAVCQSHV